MLPRRDNFGTSQRLSYIVFSLAGWNREGYWCACTLGRSHARTMPARTTSWHADHRFEPDPRPNQPGCGGRATTPVNSAREDLGEIIVPRRGLDLQGERQTSSRSGDSSVQARLQSAPTTTTLRTRPNLLRRCRPRLTRGTETKRL